MPKTRAALGKGSQLLVTGVLFSLCAGSPCLAQVSAAPVNEAGSSPSLLLAVAVDEIGITAGDLERTRTLVMSLLDLLPQDSQVMVSRFIGEERVALQPTSDRSRIDEALAALQAGGKGGVAVPDGLFDTVRALAGHKADARVVLMVSAGHEREGDLQFEDPLNEATSNGISVFTLAVGQGDGKLLRRISKVTGGDSFRMEIADASLLRHAIMSRVTGSARAVSETVAEPSPEAAPARPTSRALVMAMAVLGLLAALFLLGAIVLYRRRGRRPPAGARAPAAPSPRAAPKPPAEAEARTVLLTDAQQASLSSSGPASTGLDEDEDIVIEQTLLGNLNPTLLALSGPGTGKNFPFSPTGKTSIGRSRRNDIVVPEDAASAQHCRIDREGDAYVLYDLTSTNGTWLNDVRTERAILRNGDRLKVGDTLFAVSLFSGT